jgi:outer membrane protein TolC
MPQNRRSFPVVAGLLTALMIASAWPTVGDDGAPSSLPELVRSAVATNPQVGYAETNIQRAQADVKLVSSALLPKLDLNGTWWRFREEQSIELAPGEEFVVRPLEDWVWSADLRQTLFYGLRDWRARDVARLNRDIADLDRLTTVNDLTLAVAAQFYSVVAARESLDVARTALEANEGQLRLTERLYEVGEATAADRARWRSEVAGSRQREVVAEGELEIARRRLARLAGVPEVGELRTPGPIPAPSGTDQELREAALNQRIEMDVLEHQLEAAGLLIKVERGAWLPELEAAVQYLQQKAAFPSDNWASFSLNLRVPIYDGGLTKARVVKAKADLRDIQWLHEEVSRSIQDQVDNAVVTYRAATAALEAAEERNSAARQAFTQVERAYRVGEANSVDLLDATTEATDAANSEIIARAQREYQAIALRHAVGLPPLPGLDFSERSEDPAS